MIRLLVDVIEKFLPESVEFFRFLSTEESKQFSSAKFSAVEKLLLLPESAMMKSACCRSWWPWTLKCTLDRKF